MFSEQVSTQKTTPSLGSLRDRKPNFRWEWTPFSFQRQHGNHCRRSYCRYCGDHRHRRLCHLLRKEAEVQRPSLGRLEFLISFSLWSVQKEIPDGVWSNKETACIYLSQSCGNTIVVQKKGLPFSARTDITEPGSRTKHTSAFQTSTTQTTDTTR